MTKIAFRCASFSTTETVTRKDSQLSEHHSKRSELSSASEMTALVHEAADLSAASANWKERVNAAARALSLTFGRAKRHYFGEARRIDAEEMDRARARIEELREAELRRKSAGHLAWLNTTVERLRQTDEEFHSFDVDGFERAVARLGSRDRAVGNPRAAED